MLVGDVLGSIDGFIVGVLLGSKVGSLLGMFVGPCDAATVGIMDGLLLGYLDGSLLGDLDGFLLGYLDGCLLGCCVGTSLGHFVGSLLGIPVGVLLDPLDVYLLGFFVGIFVDFQVGFCDKCPSPVGTFDGSFETELLSRKLGDMVDNVTKGVSLGNKVDDVGATFSVGMAVGCAVFVLGIFVEKKFRLNIDGEYDFSMVTVDGEPECHVGANDGVILGLPASIPVSPASVALVPKPRNPSPSIRSMLTAKSATASKNINMHKEKMFCDGIMNDKTDLSGCCIKDDVRRIPFPDLLVEVLLL